MKERLVIVGASAMGREAFAYAREAGLGVGGFLDSRADILEAFHGYPPVLASPEEYAIRAGDRFLVAVGDPAAKMRYVRMIAERGGRFKSVIHPTAYIGMNVTVSPGCIVCPHVAISNDTLVGSHVIVNLGVTINHDNQIGDGCTICPSARLAGRVKIGRNVFVGTGAILIPDVALGDGVFVAAGATVTRSFESGRLMGTPARPK